MTNTDGNDADVFRTNSDGNANRVLASVCQTCGDIGYKELLLCCSKCQISLEHRYCLAKIPEADDHEFTYTCLQCISGSAEASRKRKKLFQDPREEANGISSVADVDVVEGQICNSSPLETDIFESFVKDVLPEACLEHHKVSHRIDQTDVLIHDKENRQANTRSPVSGVEAEVQTEGIAFVPQTSDPFLQLDDFNDISSSPQFHNVNDKNQETEGAKDVLPEACLEHHTVSHRIDQTDVLIHDMEKRQANTRSPVSGVEAEVQTEDIAFVPQTSDPFLQLDDFNDISSSPQFHDVNDKNQESEGTKDVLPEACLEHHTVSLRLDQTDVLIHDMEKRQANTSSPVTGVEAEVKTADIALVPQTSDPFLQPADFSDNRSPHCHDVNDKNQEIKSTNYVLPEACMQHRRVSHRMDQTDVLIHEVQTEDISLVTQTSDHFLQPADFTENNRDPHCHNLNDDKNQKIRSDSKRLISEGGGKSDEKVNGQESQVNQVASARAMETSSPRPFGGCSNYVYAKPIIDPSWRGCFDIGQEKVGRVVAHLSNKVCLKVVEAAKSMPVVLCAQMMARLQAWPKSFSVSSPTDENIALYFFPGKKSAVKAFERLLRQIIDRDLVLKVLLENVELLIFSSNQLLQPYQLFNGKYYLWGVYRARKDAATHE